MLIVYQPLPCFASNDSFRYQNSSQAKYFFLWLKRTNFDGFWSFLFTTNQIEPLPVLHLIKLERGLIKTHKIGRSFFTTLNKIGFM
jgi:hypothetical protein